MRWQSCVVAVALALVATAGCKKDADSMGSDKRRLLLGTWDTEFIASDRDTNNILMEREKYYFPASSRSVYTFTDSGILSVRDGSRSTPDRYLWALLPGETSILLIPQNDSAAKLYYRLYRLTETALVLEDTVNGVASWTGLVK